MVSGWKSRFSPAGAIRLSPGQVGGPEGPGQQICDRAFLFNDPFAVHQDHLHIQAELREYLPAGSARASAVGGGYRDGKELTLSLRDGLENGDPFRAHAGGVGGILDVDAIIDPARSG